MSMRIPEMPDRNNRIHRQLCVYDPFLCLWNRLRQPAPVRTENCRVAASGSSKQGSIVDFVSVDAGLGHDGRAVENECRRFYSVCLGEVLHACIRVKIVYGGIVPIFLANIRGQKKECEILPSALILHNPSLSTPGNFCTGGHAAT